MLNELMTLVQSLTARISLRDESGQALVEYGLLVGLIAVACMRSRGAPRDRRSRGFFTQITNALTSRVTSNDEASRPARTHRRGAALLRISLCAPRAYFNLHLIYV